MSDQAMAADKAEREEAKATPCECQYFEAVDDAELIEENLASGDYETWTTGCNSDTRRTFAPGHDAKLKSFLIKHGSLGHSIAVMRSGVRITTEAEAHADKYGFGHMVAAGIAKAQGKALARQARAERKEAEAAERAAAKAAKVGESAATKAVFRNLQASDGQPNSVEPIGASFGEDFDTYVDLAKKWLGDKSELKSATIENADWPAIHAWFIKGEHKPGVTPKKATGERKLAEDAGLVTHDGNEARQARELAAVVAAEEAKHAAEVAEAQAAKEATEDWTDADLADASVPAGPVGPVKAKVGRWEREGVVTEDGGFKYSNRSGQSVTAPKGTYTLLGL